VAIISGLSGAGGRRRRLLEDLGYRVVDNLRASCCNLARSWPEPRRHNASRWCWTPARRRRRVHEAVNALKCAA
jgi:RNase adaptor protein for sRNA GlmZ degradation